MLPQVRSYYVNLGTSGMLNELFADCTAAADPSVDFSNYVGINLMFNAELDGAAWGGSRHTTLDGVTRFWYTTWEPPWGYARQAVIAHEMGHGFGLPHSSGAYGATHDNEWDVMSDTSANCSRSTDPSYGCLGQHTIAYHKHRLEWISEPRLYEAVEGVQTITLEQLALPETGNFQLATIPIGGSTSNFYTVEVRNWEGYDVKLPGEAVVIHEVDTTRSRPAWVVDIDGDGDTGDDGAMWVAGETFSDAANQISISIDSVSASGYTVTITLGEGSPTQVPTGTPTQSPTHTPLPPTPTASDTPDPTSTPTLTPSDTPEPTSTPLPPTATSTDTPAPTGTSTPVPPTATVTPVPSASSTPTRPPTAEFAREDLNQDGATNVLAVQLCMNVFLGMEDGPGIVSRADINSDGLVNVLDVQAIVNAFLSA